MSGFPVGREDKIMRTNYHRYLVTLCGCLCPPAATHDNASLPYDPTSKAARDYPTGAPRLFWGNSACCMASRHTPLAPLPIVINAMA